MLVLEKLRFKGIGRFVEEQIILFDSLGKFVQLGGQNNNTKGSSGAGKSTVFMALDYLFGVSNRPSTVLKSRLSDDGIFVEGTFKYDGKPLTITRGKKLAIDLDGEVTTGNSNKTEEKLDFILGMHRDLFRKMLHKRQKEGGFFLDMGPKDVNDFLTSSLGLDEYKNKIQIAENEIKKLIEKKENVLKHLIAARSGLQATESALSSIGQPPVKDIHQSVVLELREKCEKSSAAFEAVKSKHAIERQTLELKKPKYEYVAFDRAALDALDIKLSDLKRRQGQIQVAENERIFTARSELSKVQAQVAKFKEEIRLGALAAEKIQEIAVQLKAIKDGKCYNCGQDWKDSVKEEKLKRDALAYRAHMLAGNQAQTELPYVESTIPILENGCKPRENPEVSEISKEINNISSLIENEKKKEKDHNTIENAKISALRKEFDSLDSTLRATHSTELEQVRGQADIDRRAFEAAVGKLKAYEAARARYESSLASLEAQEKGYKQQINDWTNDTTEIQNRLDMVEEIKRALKSYLSCSFDEALETISENATRLIRHIPNMANVTIQLEGIKETQDGKIKEEVNAVIHMDGENNIDIRSLCGGERTALDLAIDLSVIDLLESKANKGIDLFILDEPFDGLDTVCIEMALEVLKNSNSNKRLIIVDHNPEVKEMVESRLVVVRDGATSRVVQAA